MDRDPALDDAIETATDRTRAAQGEFEQAVEPDQAPRPAAAERVVRRAEDLHDLTTQAIDDEGVGPRAPERLPDGMQGRR